MKIYCDSNIHEACVVVEGQEPRIIQYSEPVTNNVGEYKAVLEAIKVAKELELKDVEILTDSQLVANQVHGSWKCRRSHLLPFRDKVRELLYIGIPLGQNVEITWFNDQWLLSWIPREENLAGKVLG